MPSIARTIAWRVACGMAASRRGHGTAGCDSLVSPRLLWITSCSWPSRVRWSSSIQLYLPEHTGGCVFIGVALPHPSCLTFPLTFPLLQCTIHCLRYGLKVYFL